MGPGWVGRRHGTIMPVTVEIRRGSARFVDRAQGRVTRHAFSFGSHYDAEHLGFGPMLCHDDHLLGTGRGFEAHPHSDVEIVTWVLSGALEHIDSGGDSHVVEPGSVALLSAGSGVEHAETALTATRFVQVWLRPEEPGAPPAYEVQTVSPEPGRLSQVLSLGGAAFEVARLEAGTELFLPEAPRVHTFVSTGALLRSSLAEPLSAGDAFLMTDEVSHIVTAAVPTELLVWTFCS